MLRIVAFTFIQMVEGQVCETYVYKQIFLLIPRTVFIQFTFSLIRHCVPYSLYREQKSIDANSIFAWCYLCSVLSFAGQLV